MSRKANAATRPGKRSKKARINNSVAAMDVAPTKFNPDSDYFASYSHLAIHEEMLKDSARTGCYQRAILDNSVLFKNKVVLDVGAGTGILSLFAARAGARRVFAVEASEMAVQCSAIVKCNNLENTITVLHGKMEELVLPEKVDIIVSEWMGYFLIYESMLNTIVAARDKWLKPHGLMFPSHARIYILPFNFDDYWAEHIAYWKDVYGFDYSPIQEVAQTVLVREPQIEQLGLENIMSESVLIKSIDCGRVTLADLSDWTTEFTLHSQMCAQLHGLAVYFDCDFPAAPGNATLTLSTSPSSAATHWAQSLLFVDQPVQLGQDDTVSGRIHVSTSLQNSRTLDIELLDLHILRGSHGHPISDGEKCVCVLRKKAFKF